jgi:hypothetical protein
VHVCERSPAGRGRRHDPAAEHEPRASAEADRDRVAEPKKGTAVAAEIANRRDASLEHRSGRVGKGVFLDAPNVAVKRGEVHMRVDEAREQRVPLEIEDPGA